DGWSATGATSSTASRLPLSSSRQPRLNTRSPSSHNTSELPSEYATFSDCCAICQTPASGFGLKSADQALRAPHARPLCSLEKSYSIAREMPAVRWSCRIRRTRILLLFSSNLERFARLYSLQRHTRVNKRHARWSRGDSERNCDQLREREV